MQPINEDRNENKHSTLQNGKEIKENKIVTVTLCKSCSTKENKKRWQGIRNNTQNAEKMLMADIEKAIQKKTIGKALNNAPVAIHEKKKKYSEEE